MKQDKRRGLTRIALALALAGYCVAPVALAEDSAWVDSGETNIFQGVLTAQPAAAEESELMQSLRQVCKLSARKQKQVREFIGVIARKQNVA